MANIIFIDNFDSFTYNLVDQFRAMGHQVTIFRNTVDTATIIGELDQHPDSVLLLSPGPGAPSQAGNMPTIIQECKGKHPIIGICLGHQAIVEAYGGTVGGAGEIIHGKVSMMSHNHHPLFNGFADTFAIARYHSLVATSMPTSLTEVAHADGLVMAVVNESDKVCGYQFHPESIMTTQGAQLLENTLHWALQHHDYQRQGAEA